MPIRYRVAMAESDGGAYVFYEDYYLLSRKADDLEMFTNKIVDVYEQTDKEFEDLKQNPGCKIISITTDHKLIKNFRRLKGDIIEASWECTDCFYLSTEEAVARKIGHRQAYN